MINNHDVARCYSEILAKGTKESMLGSVHKNQVYTLTGAHKHHVKELIQELSKNLNIDLKFKKIDDNQLNEWLKQNTKMPDMEREFVIETWRSVKDGKALMITDDLEKIVNRKPLALSKFVEDHKDHFRS